MSLQDAVQNELKRRHGSSKSWTPIGYNSSQQSSSAAAPASTVPTIDQVQAELDRRRKKREAEAAKRQKEEAEKQRERNAAAQKTAESAIKGGSAILQSNGLLQAAKLRTMTPAELNRQYDDVQKKLTELKEAGRTYGVMQAGGIYTPTAETEIKKLEEERAELLRLIVDKQTTEDLSKPSDYWKRDAAQKEAALGAAKQKNQTGRNYAGMMQGGISAAEAGVEDRWNPQGVSKEQRAYDKARENYYYTMNAERWDSLPEGLKNRVMEAASISKTGLLDWDDPNAAVNNVTPETRYARSQNDAARLNSLKNDITAAGYDAEALIQYAARMQNAERMQQEKQQAADLADRGFVGKVAATVGSYGTSALSGLGSVGILAQRVFGGGSGIEDYRPVDINTPAQSFSHITTAARRAVSEDMGETGEFLYGAINSAVDSAVRLLIGKAAASGFVPSGAEAEAAEQVNKLVSGLVSAQMGTQVFTNSFIEAKESGKTDDQAIVDAVVSAAIESITEKYSVEEIIRNPNGLTARALANSFGTEALEEMNSNALNTIYDELQYGDESKLRSQAQAYIDAGMDPKEAWKIVLKEYGREVLLDGLAGGISGFAMSAANEIGNRVNGYVPSAYRDLEPEADFEGGPLETAPTPDRVMKAAPKAETDAAALEAAPAAPAAQQQTTQKADARATPGDAVEKVTGISNYDMKVRRSDGKTVSLSNVDKRGTALEILNHTDNIEEHKDVATVNLMVASYKTALAGERSTPDRAEMFSELFTSALYDGIAGERKETALKGAWDSQSRLALEMAYDRGVEIARGRAAAETLGPAGKEAMEAFDYTNIDMFQAFYTAGQEGLTLQKAMNAAGVTRLGKTTQEPMKAAWKAGRKDGFSYEEAENKDRYAVSDESGQRQNGMGAGGEGRAVETGAGSRPERDSGRQRNRGAGHEGSRSSLRQLGVQSGTDAPQTVLSRTPNDYGGEIITVSDPLTISGKDGTKQTVQAIQSGRNVILYADDPMMEQHRAHEEEHLRQRNMTDEEIEVLFREKTKDLTDDEVREILNAYALDYYGLYGDETSFADLYREYLADEAAGIEHKKSADTSAMGQIALQEKNAESRTGSVRASVSTQRSPINSASESSIREDAPKSKTSRDEKFSVSEPQSSAEYRQMVQKREESETERAEQRRKQSRMSGYLSRQTYELRRQMIDGTHRRPTKVDITETAKTLRYNVGSNSMKVEDLQERLATIALTPERIRDPMAAFSEMKKQADILASEMVQNELHKTVETAADWKNIRAAFRPDGKAVKLFISGADRALLPGNNGYDYIRKHNMGTFFLSSAGMPVENFYETLTKQFPDYFPDTIREPADQLVQIDEVLSKFRSIFKNPYEGNLAPATELLSQEILQRLYNSIVLKPSAEAYAQEHEEMLRSYYRQKLNETKASWQDQVEQMRREFSQKRAEERTARKETRDRDDLLKVARRLSRIKASKATKELIESLVGDIDLVAKSMTGRTIIGQWVGNVSSEAVPGEEAERPGTKTVDLTALREFVDAQKANNPDFILDKKTEAKISRIEKTQIADMKISDVREILNALRNIENEIRTHNRLINAEDQRKIYEQTADVVSNLQSMDMVEVTGLRGFIRRNMLEGALTPVHFFRRVTGHKTDDPLYRAAEDLAKGEEKAIAFIMEAEKRFEKFHADKAFMESIRGKTAKQITITARTDRGIRKVQITPAMRIALYLHSLNNDNMRHIETGGIRIPDLALLGKGAREDAFKRGTHAYFRKTDLQSIAASMTAKERAYAEEIAAYYKHAAEKINEVSLLLVGFEKAGLLNYFPIHVWKDALKNMTPETVAKDVSLENIGFMKERTGAANPIDLWDATETIMSSIQQNAKYIGLAIPVRNMGRLYGNTNWGILDDPDDDSDQKPAAKTTAISAELGRIWGSSATKYIDKLMGDIQTRTPPGEEADKLMNKIRSNYAQAVLTANPSVALKQFSAYPTAAIVVGWKPLKQAANPTKKVDLSLIDKYSPWLWYRSQGSMERELGELAKGKRKVPEWMDWVNKTDAAVVKKLWLASEYYIRDTREDLKINTDEYYRATAEVFGKIIQESQPDNAIMHRPQILRSESAFVRQINMFKSQAYLTLNAAYDCVQNLRDQNRHLRAAEAGNDGTEESRQKIEAAKTELDAAKQQVGRTFSALAVSQITTTVIGILYNLLRGRKEEYEKDGEPDLMAAMNVIWKEFVSSAAGSVPFGSEIYETVMAMLGEQYYGMDALSLSAINDFVAAAQSAAANIGTIGDVFRGEAPAEDLWRIFEKLLSGGSKLLGIPWDNGRNVVRLGLYQALHTALPSDEADYWYRSLTAKTTAQGRRNKDYDAIYDAALRGDAEAYRKMRESTETYIWQSDDSFHAGEITREEAQEKAAEAIEKAMKKRIRADYLAGSLPEDQARTLLTELAGTEGDELAELIANWKAEKETGVSYDDAKEAFLSGEITGEEAEALKTAYGGSDQETAAGTIQKWQFQKDTGIAWDDMQKSYVNGDITFDEAVSYRVQYGGEKEKAAKATVQQWTCEKDTGIPYDDLARAYIDGTITFDQTVQYRSEYGGFREKEAAKTVTEWKMEKETGYAYGDLRGLYLDGTVSQKDATAWLQTYGGQYKKNAESKVMEWTCEKDTGINYEEMGQLYVDGEITADKARNLRVKYGGSSKEDARKTVLKWDCEKDNGVKYDDISNAYLSGEITESQAIDWRVKYGEQDRNDAEMAVQAWKWREENPEYGDLSDSHIDKYIDHAGPAGISVEVYYDARMTVRDIATIRDENGKQIKGPKEQYEEYILSMPLTQTQKSAMWYALKEKNWKDPSWV